MVTVLIVSPHIRPDGAKHPNAFEVRLAGGDAVLCVSETPLFDAARVLLKTGKANADDVLAMRHVGSEHDALRGKADQLAVLVIGETGHRPRRRQYRPHPLAQSIQDRANVDAGTQGTP